MWEAALSGKKVLFHHDNARAHTSAIATAKLFDLRYEILLDPPYSPDLTPSNYFIYALILLPFTRICACICSKSYFYVIMLLCFKHKVPMPTNEYFEGFDKKYFIEGIKKLADRCNKCIQLTGD